jgi:cadmium resistance protein CadD (predicted permease)
MSMEVEVVAALIPLFGIVFGIAVAIVAIIAAHREKTQRVELRHKERLAAMEKGLELPPELEDPGNGGKRSRTGSLRSGLIGLGVGIVLYFALDRLAGDDVALLGLIPAAVGLANLIFYFIEGRKAAGDGNGGALR